MTLRDIKRARIATLSTLCTVGLFAVTPSGWVRAQTEQETEDREGTTFTSDDARREEGAVDAGPADRTLEAHRTEATDRTAANAGALYFAEVDNSNDYRLTWDEIRTSYEQEVAEAGWTRMEFFDEFDTDGDEFLDEDEYSEFLSDIGLEEPPERSSFIDID